jgi:hypothetical protein
LVVGWWLVEVAIEKKSRSTGIIIPGWAPNRYDLQCEWLRMASVLHVYAGYLPQLLLPYLHKNSQQPRWQAFKSKVSDASSFSLILSQIQYSSLVPTSPGPVASPSSWVPSLPNCWTSWAKMIE